MTRQHYDSNLCALLTRAKDGVAHHRTAPFEPSTLNPHLFGLYRPLLDTLHFLDNSSATPRLIFKDEAGKTTINDAALYEQLRGEFA